MRPAWHAPGTAVAPLHAPRAHRLEQGTPVDQEQVPQLLMRRPHLDDLPPVALPAGYELRAAGDADAGALATTLASAVGPEWTTERVRAALLDAPDVDTTLVATSGGAPVGTASARLDLERFPGSGYLHWVGVHAAHQGQRLGHALSLAVLHRFRELGCRDAVLETDPPRLPAIRTYLRLGFRPEPVVPAHEALWPAILAEIEAFGRRSEPAP
jgi:mycothiol synthase